MNLTEYSVQNRRAYITLNRPEKRNALNPELISELKLCFDQAAEDREVKVVILKANGNVFCAGADLEYIRSLQNFSFDENLADSNHLKALFLRVYTLPKPVVAQVEGHAIAGGCGLATVCDFVISAQDAKFGYTEVRIGFVPAMVLVFLIRKVGEARATNLLLSGELVTADAMREAGLVYRVSQPEQVEAEVEGLAELLIRNNSGESMAMTKKLIKDTHHLSLEEALELAASANALARSTADCRKGISSFLNKESIEW